MTPFEDPSHPISTVLFAHSGKPSATIYERAMCRNLLAEHRVSTDRFASFIAVAGAPSDLAQVGAALEEYQKHVRPLKTLKLAPAYQLPDNATNAVTLPPDTQVATLLDLTRLGRVYAEAKSKFKYPEFVDYRVDDPKNYTQINQFLTSGFDRAEGPTGLLKAILRARKRYRASKDDKWLHPTWAAEWKSLAPHLQRTEPVDWLRAVGVPIEGPRWIAAFRYRVADPKRPIQLFRPTQLDVGWYAHHFPSPPAASLEQGGHAMYLLPDSGHRPNTGQMLVWEYLHQQIDFTLRDWRIAGSHLGLAALDDDDLEADRQKHWELLQSVYSAGPVVEWMSNC